MPDLALKSSRLADNSRQGDAGEATRSAISGQLEARGSCFSGSFGYDSAWKFAGSRSRAS